MKTGKRRNNNNRNSRRLWCWPRRNKQKPFVLLSKLRWRRNLAVRRSFRFVIHRFFTTPRSAATATTSVHCAFLASGQTAATSAVTAAPNLSPSDTTPGTQFRRRFFKYVAEENVTESHDDAAGRFTYVRPSLKRTDRVDRFSSSVLWSNNCGTTGAAIAIWVNNRNHLRYRQHRNSSFNSNGEPKLRCGSFPPIFHVKISTRKRSKSEIGWLPSRAGHSKSLFSIRSASSNPLKAAKSAVTHQSPASVDYGVINHVLCGWRKTFSSFSLMYTLQVQWDSRLYPIPPTIGNRFVGDRPPQRLNLRQGKSRS